MINLLKIGHNPLYQDSSPGFLLIKKVIEDNIGGDRFNEVSFVTGAEWNNLFKPEKLKVFSVQIFNTTMKGRIVFFVNKSKGLVKKWILGQN